MSAWIAVALLQLAGCSSGADLAVDVRTDFAAGRDFVGVRIELHRSDPRGSLRRADEREDVLATTADDYYAGERVAEFSGLKTGRWWLRVALIRADGAPLVERVARFTLDDDHLIAVVITRSCLAVVCPGAGDPEGNTECLGGRCVDPLCVDGDDPACESQCEADGDCAVLMHADCADSVCEGGVCLLRADDDRCAGGLLCDVVDGCEMPPPDAGPRDAGPGRIDSGPSTTDDAGPRADTGPRPLDSGPSGCMGECSPGARETSSQGCGNCGSQPTERTCGGDCRWSGWSATGGCSGEGPCSPGATDSMGMGCGCTGTASCTRTCNGSCSWDGWSCGGCTGDVACYDVWGDRVCPGNAGLSTTGCAMGFHTCTCSSSGSWTGCTGVCMK